MRGWSVSWDMRVLGSVVERVGCGGCVDFERGSRWGMNVRLHVIYYQIWVQYDIEEYIELRLYSPIPSYEAGYLGCHVRKPC